MSHFEPDQHLHHYHMPAEWAPHRGTILTWPHRPRIWRGVHDQVEQTFAQLAAHLSQVEEVHISVPDLVWRERASKAIGAAGGQLWRVVFYEIDSDDVWARDHGPIFVVKRPNAPAELPPLMLLDWDFNAWGGKFSASLDNQVPRKLNARWGLPRVAPGLVMEGGSLEVNGEGDLLTTESVLLKDTRNPHLSADGISAALQRHLGVSRLHWLGRGLEGDDTDGHIDDLARFVDAQTIVVAYTDDPAHPDHAALTDNWQRLHSLRNAEGAPFRVVALPVPAPITFADEHLPASYANFYIANGLVLVPTFDQPTDAVALQTLQSLMPNHKVVGLDGRWLVTQYGNIHCVTQQIPLA